MAKDRKYDPRYKPAMLSATRAAKALGVRLNDSPLVVELHQRMHPGPQKDDRAGEDGDSQNVGVNREVIKQLEHVVATAEQLEAAAKSPEEAAEEAKGREEKEDELEQFARELEELEARTGRVSSGSRES